jgi:hypothetical protein
MRIFLANATKRRTSKNKAIGLQINGGRKRHTKRVICINN